MPTKPKAKTNAIAPKAKPTRPMPKFAPAPEWIKEQFADLISHFPDAEPRKMFGYPSAFINGTMACCVFGDKLMLRLSEADRAKFLKLKDARMFEPMAGRPMKEYVEVPADLLANPTNLKKWVRKGMAYAQSLPAKKAKTK